MLARACRSASRVVGVAPARLVSQVHLQAMAVSRPPFAASRLKQRRRCSGKGAAHPICEKALAQTIEALEGLAMRFSDSLRLSTIVITARD